MTDRELLELAAKAVGLSVEHFNAEGLWQNPEFTWNPLTRNDDAFRLMTDLRLEPSWQYSNEEVVVSFAGHDLEPVREVYDEYSPAGLPQNNHRPPALRRAIVRAAASIGKDMP